MGARDVLDDLHTAGLSVKLIDDKIVIAPKARLTDPMREAVRAHRAELVAALKPEGPLPATAAAAPPMTLATKLAHRLMGEQADRCHSPSWSEAEIATFTTRVLVFMRRGIDSEDADDLAERLVVRDREGDDRALCLECRHHSGRATAQWRCNAARDAGLPRELAADLATLLQRCPSYERSR